MIPGRDINAAARLKGCRPLLRPRPLLALQPSDPEPRPFLLEFPLPVACVFPESRPRVFTAFDVVTSMDSPATPPFPDYDLDDQGSDVVFRLADSSIKVPPSNEYKPSYSADTSLFKMQRHAHHHLTLPPIPKTTSIPWTSRTFSHISLSLRPDTLADVEDDVLADDDDLFVENIKIGNPLRKSDRCCVQFKCSIEPQKEEYKKHVYLDEQANCSKVGK
ncbi:hypothetical protein E2C01_002603 [Portunus trituberculatus]|uniref:Uncharacterized protein n=1 Tax=Portunus trituberculatus TaxID=210409 RepID=A0A5B7CMF9_PORTR|nr:hypothetical protein [Portunus trituberculatus]